MLPIMGEQLGIKVGSFLHKWKVELPSDRGEIKHVTSIGLKPSLTGINHEIHLAVRTPTERQISGGEDGLNNYDEFDDTERPVLAESNSNVSAREEIVTHYEEIPLQVPIQKQNQENLVLRVKSLEQRLVANTLELAAVMQVYDPDYSQELQWESVRAEFKPLDVELMNMELIDADAQLIPKESPNLAELQLNLITKNPQRYGPESFQQYNLQQEVNWAGTLVQTKRLPLTRLDIDEETLIWEGLQDMGETKEPNEFQEPNELKESSEMQELNTREGQGDDMSFPWLKDWMEGKDVFPAGEENCEEDTLAVMGNTATRAEAEFVSTGLEQQQWESNEVENLAMSEADDLVEETEDMANEGILQVNWQDMLEEESEVPNMFLSNDTPNGAQGISVRSWSEKEQPDNQETSLSPQETRTNEDSDLAQAYAQHGWRSSENQLKEEQTSPEMNWESFSSFAEPTDYQETESALEDTTNENLRLDDQLFADNVSSENQESVTPISAESNEELSVEANAEVRQEDFSEVNAVESEANNTEELQANSGAEYFDEVSEAGSDNLVDELDNMGAELERQGTQDELEDVQANAEADQSDIYAVEAPEPKSILASNENQSLWQKLNPFKSEAKSDVCKKPASKPRAKDLPDPHGLNPIVKTEPKMDEPPIIVEGLVSTRPMRRHITPNTQVAAPMSRAQASSVMRMYLVKPGDTWESLGERFGVASEILMEVNNLRELPVSNMIRVPKA